MANVGRPRIYSTVDELIEELDKWYTAVEEGEKPTITGLTLALGFCDKTTLYDYRDRPEFSHPIKRAILIVENGYEKGLQSQSVSGSIFALKNFGWQDTIHNENTNKSLELTPEERAERIKALKAKL